MVKSGKIVEGGTKGEKTGNWNVKAAGNAKRSGIDVKHGRSGQYDAKNPKEISSGAGSYHGGGRTRGQSISHKRNTEAYWEGALLVQSAGKPESHMTSMEKMEVTREGITKKELEQLKEKAGLDYDQLAYMLGVARATLIGKKGSERFSSGLSEKIMSLADIYSYGYEVFGDQQQFNQWIFQPIAAFGGKAPYELLDNQYGREEVRNVIGRIDYGVYS